MIFLSSGYARQRRIAPGELSNILVSFLNYFSNMINYMINFDIGAQNVSPYSIQNCRFQQISRPCRLRIDINYPRIFTRHPNFMIYHIITAHRHMYKHTD